MSNVVYTVLAPTTSPVSSDAFTLENHTAMTVICAGLGTGETGTVQVQEPTSGSWYNYYQGTTLLQFTSTLCSLDVWDTTATYRINKTVTALAVGVTVTKYNPFIKGV